jgi:hypothetical protein
MNTWNKFGGVLICGVEAIEHVVMLNYFSFINLSKKKKTTCSNFSEGLEIWKVKYRSLV